MSTIEALQPSELAMSKAPRRARSEPRKLIEALRAGDRSAANQVVEQTYALVYASLFRMCGDADLAADLTQDTYARAWRCLADFEGRCRFSTWLYRIAYTTFLNHVRKPQRLYPLGEGVLERQPDPGRGPEGELLDSLDAGCLRRAVLDLPDDLRYSIAAR